MSAIPFVPGTTDRRDGGVHTVLVDGGSLCGGVGLFRLHFHAERTRRPWRCAATGAVIPAGTVALVPHLGASAGRYLEPFRVSLEGWRRLTPEVRPPAPAAGAGPPA
ncbi:MAG TPA: hypothetical protein VK002_11800 [Rubricoccaceae bacterium]|nr:hypothetical protein [Rubricoccaceae bacterium]